MSAKHAVIACDVGGAETPDEYKVTITDFSRHGVFVNGEKIEPGEPFPLARDDVVVLPFGMEYRFELPDDAPRPVSVPAGKEGKNAQKTPGSKKKSAGTPGAAKRAAARGDDVAAKRVKASEAAADEGGVALAFGDEGSPSAKVEPEKRESADAHARAQTQDALDAAKKLETANAELRARLERAEEESDASAAELERAREAARAAARAAAYAAADELETSRSAAREARDELEEAEKALREITAERDAASASRNESRAALERALAAKAAAEKRAESAETSARDAVASLEAENAAHGRILTRRARLPPPPRRRRARRARSSPPRLSAPMRSRARSRLLRARSRRRRDAPTPPTRARRLFVWKPPRRWRGASGARTRRAPWQTASRWLASRTRRLWRRSTKWARVSATSPPRWKVGRTAWKGKQTLRRRSSSRPRRWTRRSRERRSRRRLFRFPETTSN